LRNPFLKIGGISFFYKVFPLFFIEFLLILYIIVNINGKTDQLKVLRGRPMDFWRVPLDSDKIKVTRGIVHIIEDRCKGCGYCIEYCPQKVLEFSTEFNAKGYHPPVVILENCLDCHYCELLCPEFAIFSVTVDPS
jgi:2-oxoglutarate ferredoxin oxidoreductase subunit delta